MNEFEKEVLHAFLDAHWREFLIWLDGNCGHFSAKTDAAVYNNIMAKLKPENKETQNG